MRLNHCDRVRNTHDKITPASQSTTHPLADTLPLWQQVSEVMQFVNPDAPSQWAPFCLSVPSETGQPLQLLTCATVMQQTLQLAEQMARTDWPLLIYGETGTGKELLARLIHHWSPRRSGPFVAVNCAAFPETLAESELFGCERGSFTGAGQSRPGYFEQADQGTLVLDEISELPLALQGKLLRVLEQQCVHRLGATKERPVSVRVLALSNRPLPELIRLGRFRADLYHRLSVLELEVPALRQRREDIPLLAEYFLQQARSRLPQPQLRWATATLLALSSYSWPGNVRQLRNVVWQAALRACQQGMAEIMPQHLVLTSMPVGTTNEAVAASSPASEMVRPLPEHVAPKLTKEAELTSNNDVHSISPWPYPSLRLKDLERYAIREALRISQGHRRRAAQLLGISLRTLFNKLRRYQLMAPR